MSNNHSRAYRDFSRYDSMSTEELEKILQSDAESLETQDAELLLYVAGLLADRGYGGSGQTVQEAYASFRQHYMPQVVQMPKRQKSRRWLSAVAAVLALVVGMSLTAQALGVDIWAVVASWTRETFYFSSGDQTSRSEIVGELEYDSLEAALADCGRDTGLVPRWIPDSMTASEAQVQRTENQESFCAAYSGDDGFVTVIIRYYVNSVPVAIEPNGDLVERLFRDGTEYFFFREEAGVRAAWIYGPYACEISGDITMEQLRAIVDSVEPG